MTNQHSQSSHISTASAVVPPRKKSWRVIRTVPLNLFVLVTFIGLWFAPVDTRQAFGLFGLSDLTTSVAELLVVFAAMASILELSKVSKPGIDNTKEVLLMFVVSMFFVVFVVAGWLTTMTIFRSSEFLSQALICVSQTVAAVKINANTLKRTIDYSVEG